ncbi:MAG: NADH-quinone oxidoreductase subunit J [Oligoflexales bacterium]|nr:NADH-quinone oxidoreductase subunit J [Oligoflexales bacterium]
MGGIITFYTLASLITLCSILVITLRHPVSAAVFLIIDLFLLAGLYASLGADFVAAIQVIVYAGAILVLFMFVIMLLNLDPSQMLGKKMGIAPYALFLLMVASLLHFFYRISAEKDLSLPELSAKADNTYEVALLLFKNYLWPFEILSMLILLAMMASIMIAKKNRARN